ncbi:ankyrin, partial [Aureobasidium melanogenum]
MPGKELNLLSLDGGGVRGLSSLYILQRIMNSIDHENPPKPCDYFDIIGGTSTGGLIAIMLGRLEMSVNECIKTYLALSKDVFHKTRRIPIGIKGDLKERYDSEALERAVKNVLRNRGVDEDTLLKNPQGTRVGETSQTTLLRTWPTTRGDPDLYETVRIWEAARATSAASTFFDSITIGEPGQRFLDGGTGANNPISHLWGEAKDVLSPESLLQNLGCLISIGTGQPGYKRFEETVQGIGKALLEIATETETTANEFHRYQSELFESKICFRFNVPRGLGDIGLAETEQISAIRSMTSDYLQTEAVQGDIRMCVQQLGERQIRPATQSSEIILQAIDRVSHDEDQDFYALSQEPRWQLANSENEFNLLERISEYQPQRVHCKISMQKTQGTTRWIVHEILSWADKSEQRHPVHDRCLWLSGIVGCGKTFLANTMIQTLLDLDVQERFEVPVVHFYFDSNNRNTLTADALLRSYVKQFLRYLYKTQKKPPMLISDTIKRIFGKRDYQPDHTQLMQKLLRPLIQHFNSSFLIVDGLDLCSPQEYHIVLECFSSLLKIPSVKIIICGRHELDIARRFPGSERLEVTHEKAAGDVALFIKQYMEQHDIKFLWARLQIDVLWQTCDTDAEIHAALTNLPKGLDETYERCIQRVQDKQQRYSLRVLQYVYTAKTPLKIDALAEALATDPETGELKYDRIPVYKVVLRAGANLIIFDEVEKFVTPTHHSVRKFLDSSRAPILEELNGLIMDDSVLNLGEMCIAHMSWHTFTSNVETVRKSAHSAETTRVHLPPIAQMGKWANPPNQKISRLMNSWVPKRKEASPSTSSHNQTPVVLTLPAAQKSLKLYGPFQNYARSNWISLSRGLTTTSTSWPRFEGLVRVDLMDPRNEYKRGDSQMFPWKSDTPAPLSSKILGWAISNEHLPLLELGLMLQQDLTMPLDDYEGLQPLYLAAKRGCTDVFRRLHGMRSSWPEAACRDSGRTALHYAAEQGHPEIVDLLLQSDKAWNIEAVLSCDHEDRAPLELAVQSGSLATIDVICGRCGSSLWHHVDDILRALTVAKALPEIVKYVVRDMSEVFGARRDATILTWVINNHALSLVPNLVNAGVSLDVDLDATNIHQVDQEMWETNRPALFFALEAPTPGLAIAFLGNGASSDVYHRLGRLKIHPIDLALSQGWTSLASDLCPKLSSSHSLRRIEVTVQVASASQRFLYADYQDDDSTHVLKISLCGPTFLQSCLKLKFMMEGRGAAIARTSPGLESARPVVVGTMGQKLGLDFNGNPFNIQCVRIAADGLRSSTDLVGEFEWTRLPEETISTTDDPRLASTP